MGICSVSSVIRKRSLFFLRWVISRAPSDKLTNDLGSVMERVSQREPGKQCGHCSCRRQIKTVERALLSSIDPRRCTLFSPDYRDLACYNGTRDSLHARAIKDLEIHHRSMSGAWDLISGSKTTIYLPP